MLASAVGLRCVSQSARTTLLIALGAFAASSASGPFARSVPRIAWKSRAASRLRANAIREPRRLVRYKRIQSIAIHLYEPPFVRLNIPSFAGRKRPCCPSSCLELCCRMIEIPSERKRRAPPPGGPDSSIRRPFSRTLRQLRCISDNAKQPVLCPKSSVLPSCGVVGSVLHPRLLCELDTAKPAALPRVSKGQTACTATWPRCLRRELVKINSQLPSSGEYIAPTLQSHPFARGDA